MEPRDRKLLVANALMWVITGIYTLSPIDLVPDIIPILGWLDDGAGWLATIAVTLYTAWRVARHGLPGTEDGGPRRTLDALARAAEAERRAGGIAGYEPMSLDEIRGL